MLCPEISNFQISSPGISFTDEKDLKDEMPFVSRVTLMIPGSYHAPANFRQILMRDSEFYSARNLPLDILVSEEFVRGFIDHGDLTLLSAKADNCCVLSICPGSVLSVIAPDSTASSSGLSQCMKASHSRLGYSLLRDNYANICSSEPERRRWRNFLAEKVSITGPIVFTWSPKDPKICPSSLAKYFYDSGASVVELGIEETIHRASDVQIPIFNLEEFKEDDADLILDVVGSVHLNIGEICGQSDDEREYSKVKTVSSIEYSGLFSPNLLIQLQDELWTYTNESNWISMTLSSPSAVPTTKIIKKKKDVALLSSKSWTSVYFPSSSGSKHFICG